MPTIDLPQGPVDYRVAGPADSTQPPVVFVHGLLVNSELWSGAAWSLAERGVRSYAIDLPLGSHTTPLNADADVSPKGVARLILDFLAALELTDVTLVGNDTGGALCQFVIDTDASRIGRLVLTNCDAFENFPPPAFRPLQWAARVPGMLTGMLAGMRFAPLRRLPIAYGWLIKRDFADAPTRTWVDPYLSDRAIRRDTIKVLRGIDPRYTFEAAEKLRELDPPTLLAWATEDRFFKLSFAERLAETIPGARLERIEDSYTFVSEDQPERLASLIEEFARDGARAAA
jgi:pimeloyl-ACP methyl ester carboxylesterase